MARQAAVKKSELFKEVPQKTEYPIETGIPVPPYERVKKYDFGFERLKIGQSLFVGKPKEVSLESHRQTIIRYANILKEKSGGEFAYTTRLAEKGGVQGFRLWRIEA